MTFQDQIKLDAQQVFLNTDEFAETVVYKSYVRPNVYNPVTIKGVITRDPPERIAEALKGIERKMEILIANDATTGRTTITVGKDIVTVSDDVGGTPENRTVTQIIDGDPAMWRLLLR